jgi:hypothetical protein
MNIHDEFPLAPPARLPLLEQLFGRIFTFGLIGRAIAAIYLASIDPVASTVRRIATIVGLAETANRALDFRIQWRERFEAKICAVAEVRLRENVGGLLRLYEDTGYSLPPKAFLVERITEDLGKDAIFLAEMAELQRLPVSGSALRRRLLALDRAVAAHMAVLVQLSFAEPGLIDPVGMIWIAGGSR